MLFTRTSPKHKTKVAATIAATVTLVFLYTQLGAGSGAAPAGPRPHSTWSRPNAEIPYAKPHTDESEPLREESAYRPPEEPASQPKSSSTFTTTTASSSPTPTPTPSPISIDHIFPHDFGPPPRNDFCEDRYGVDFLKKYASNHTEFCTDGDSSLQCFYGSRSGGFAYKPFDYFCVAEGVAVIDGELEMSCEPSEEKKAELETFPEYMYWTGVKKILDNHVRFKRGEKAKQTLKSLQCGSKDKRRSEKSTAILFKRDTGANMWHSLMEVMMYYTSLDILSIAQDDEGEPFFSAKDDTKDLQVLWTDEVPPGPYSDLWTLYSSKPTVHIDDLDLQTTCFDRVIIPLPGHTNPLWEGDWHTLDCTNSTLLDAFSRRVLRHLDIGPPEKSDKLIVTILNRKKTRQLPDLDAKLEKLKRTYPSVTFRLLDLSTISFSESLAVYRQTDVLVGTHGAGLTGQMFMDKRKSVVEFIPPDFWHRGFRNMASLLGHRYYSLHGASVPEDKDADWRVPPVRISEERFMHAMEVAIKAQTNIGRLNMDLDRN